MSDIDKKVDPEALTKPSSRNGEGTTSPHDAVFGAIAEDGPNYRNVGWIGTSIIMMKTQIGLGVLSIPAAFDTLGMIPGVIFMILIAMLTTWGAYIAGKFKLKHPEIYGIDDAAGLIFGRIGQEILSVGSILFLIFCTGSSMLGISIGLKAVSSHSTCTAVFVAASTVIVILFASIRTLSRISSLAWVGLVSIFTAILIVTIAVGAQDQPKDAPAGPWTSNYKIVNNPTFTDGISAMATFVFAYASTPFYFPIVAKMQDYCNFSKALFLY